MRKYAIALFASTIFASHAFGQGCNSPSGFIQTDGPIPLNNLLALGPDCNHVQDGGSPGFVNVGKFATGACTTDDSVAINAAIAATPNGGTLYFPPAPGGCWGVGAGAAILLPSSKAITILCAGRGDSSTSAIKAIAPITAVIGTSLSFVRGDRISNCSIFANKLAQYGLKMDLIAASTFDSLDIYDATTINFRLGDGVHATQENTLFAIRLDNPQTTVLANLPTYDLEVNGTNNNILHVKAANAKTANIHTSTTSAGNTFVGAHGYDFFSGAPQTPVNNFLIEGVEDTFLAWEGDGSSSANVQVNGFQNIISNGFSQFQGVTAQIGIQFATATNGNIASTNTFLNSTTVNSVVQAGTATGPGNFLFGNYNGTNGSVIGSSWQNTVPATLTAGCNGAGSSIAAGSTKYSGRVTGQTAVATQCTVTFNGGPFAATPFCAATGETGALTSTFTNTTTLTVFFASTANFVWNYVCVGQ